MKKNILFFVMLILITDLFAQQHIDSYIRNDWPDSRYTDHQDGTITDTVTGLMWKKCSEGQTYQNKTCTGTATEHDWKTALEIAQKSSFAGYSDWRLGNIKELASLTAYDRNYPAINITIFPNTPSNMFWSSSPSGSGYAFQLNFAGSGYNDEYYDGYDYEYKSSRSFCVRLVRFKQ